MNILTEIPKDKNIDEGFRAFFFTKRTVKKNFYSSFCNRLHNQVGMKQEKEITGGADESIIRT